ncbi:MAG: DNA polymerase I [Planctomycetota bacterium]|nr:DNA polymerase I [Planctomycetota bacterium]
MTETLYVIDGHAQAYQAFYAMGGLSSPNGIPTGAIFGFTNILRSILQKQQPTYCVVVFDAKGPTFRHERYPAYKAQRKPMPEELIPQFDWIKQILEGYRIPVFEVSGFEADDLMGTLARQASNLDIAVTLVTPDKDMKQLLGPLTNMYISRKNEFITSDSLLDSDGLRPDQFCDFLGLTGDSVDNIPGIPGVGPKTAKKLLLEFETLEAVLASADQVRGKKLQERLRDHQDQALLSRELATINVQAPVEFQPDTCRRQSPDLNRLTEIFETLGFRRFLNNSSPKSVTKDAHYHLVDSQEKLNKLLARWKLESRFAFDLETTSTDPTQATLVGISVSFKEAEAFYIPIRVPKGEDYIEESTALASIEPFVTDPNRERVGQNLKYDDVVLACHGIQPGPVFLDTLIAAWLLNPSQRGGRSLDALALAHLNYKTVPIHTLIGKGKSQKTLDQVSVTEVCTYACEDADIAFRLASILEKALHQEKLWELFSQLEMPLLRVLVGMEATGITLDRDLLKQISERLGERIEHLREWIHTSAGHPFNIDSPAQLRTVLFDELELPPGKKTKTGYSTDAEVLEQLRDKHPIAGLLLEYRGLVKLTSTYVDALPRLIHPTTGRIHTSFHQSGTATGRLSSSDPNLQNIPIRTTEGRKIRAAFVAPTANHQLVSADYSQVELRMLAHLSSDQTLTEAFKHGEDIHTSLAASIFDTSPDQVSAEQRRQAKAVNFGIVYGQTPFGLSKELGIPRDEAAEFIDAYHQRFPGVTQWIQEVIKRAESEGEVQTLLGRRRPLPGLSSQQPMQRDASRRMAVNTIVQGSAADLIKRAMIDVYQAIYQKELPATLLLQIHDELLFEIESCHLDQACPQIESLMTNALPLQVPLVVDLASGSNWADTK